MYLLPWGPQGTWLRDGALGQVLGDWQITGLFSAISGSPIDFSASACRSSRYRTTPRRPTSPAHPKCSAASAPNELWFDTSVFSAPAPLAWGNVERNALLTGPGYVNLDASIVKIIRFGSRRAEIRADFFNALNTPHYANPNGSFGNANFGRVTAILASDRAHDPFWWKVLVLTQHW